LLATEAGLQLFQPQSLNPPQVLEQLGGLRPDLVIVAAYGLILPKRVLELPSLGTLNVHPSLLPRHRGPSPVANAILEGDRVTGVSIMIVDPRVDSGPVLARRTLGIEPKDTTGSLTERLARVGADLLVETLPRWSDGEVRPEPQDEGLATYSRMISKRDGEIDWQAPADRIGRQVRAFDPWPGTYSRWRGKILRVLGTGPVLVESSARPGEVVRSEDRGGGVAIGTGEGALGLERVQLEGRKVVDVGSFILGHGDFVGSVLPN
jgi:methionyl-tRNA formyltransferase